MTPDAFLAYIRARVTNNKDAAELVALLLAEHISVTRPDYVLDQMVKELEAQRTEPDDSEGTIPF